MFYPYLVELKQSQKNLKKSIFLKVLSLLSGIETIEGFGLSAGFGKFYPYLVELKHHWLP